MAEETKTPKEPIKGKAPQKKKSSWFQKIPTRVLFSPAGLVLAFVALIIEVIDLVPIPVIDQIWELPIELMFIGFFMIIVEEATLKSMVIPFIIERVPLINDFLPTWFLKIIS